MKAPQEFSNQGCGQRLPDGSFGPEFNKNGGLGNWQKHHRTEFSLKCVENALRDRIVVHYLNQFANDQKGTRGWNCSFQSQSQIV